MKPAVTSSACAIRDAAQLLHCHTLVLTAPVPEQVDHTFTVTGVGTVVSGRLLAGSIRVGDQLMLGPLDSGAFTRVLVTGIQRSQVRAAH